VTTTYIAFRPKPHITNGNILLSWCEDLGLYMRPMVVRWWQQITVHCCTTNTCLFNCIMSLKSSLLHNKSNFFRML